MKIDYKKLKKIKWYRQATDSVQYFIFGPGVKVLELVNADINIIISAKADHWRAFYNEDFILRKAKSEIRKFEKDKNYLKKAHKFWLRAGIPLRKKIEQVRLLDLSALSNEQIVVFNKDLGVLARDIWLVPIFIDIFDPNSDFLVNAQLKKARLKLSQDEISLLLQPDELLETQKYQSELYKLLRKKYSFGDLASIIKKYYFVNCSYADGQGLTIKQIKNDLSNLYKEANVNFEIKKLRNYRQDLFQRKRVIYKKYKMTKTMINFLGFFSELATWRDERKTLLQKTVYALNLLGRQIARRSNLSWSQVNVCPPYEIDSILVKPSLIKHYENLSKNNYLQIWDSTQKKMIFFDKRIRKRLIRLLEPGSDLLEIRGQTANLGKISGKVRVVSGESDFKNFRQNEILVTAMTRPEFVPLMRKALAIITDEGGVTSHAAIVSRELNKPCIIGTRIATKVFKDGDLVEVNANHGWVRKLTK